MFFFSEKFYICAFSKLVFAVLSDDHFDNTLYWLRKNYKHAENFYRIVFFFQLFRNSFLAKFN